MRRDRIFWSLILPLFLLGSTAAPSWAWGRWGFRGPRVGLYLGAGPWGYDPYYYDPYYAGYPYYYPNPYYPYSGPGYATAPAPVDESTEEAPSPSPNHSRQDLRFLNSQIARARDQVDYEFDDGDISRAQHRAEIHRLSEIAKAAHAAAKANGGTLTADQEDGFLRQLRGEETPAQSYGGGEPPEEEAPVVQSGPTPAKVTGEIARLRDLLDKKLAEGNITKAQHDGMSRYLDRIDQHVRSDASTHHGTLTPDEENAAWQQLQRVSDSINQNFVQP